MQGANLDTVLFFFPFLVSHSREREKQETGKEKKGRQGGKEKRGDDVCKLNGDAKFWVLVWFGLVESLK